MRLLTLFEGISPILYHLTSLRSLKDIISSNKIRLSASFSNPSEEQTGSDKLFFLSTTRSKIGGYTLRPAYDGSVLLVLDGRKLSHNYSGSPVDYWGQRMKSIDFKYDEMEDRIYSNEPYIDNILDYIKEIHVLIMKPITMDGRRALLEVKKSGIPLFLYDNEKDFLHQRNPKKLDDFEFSDEKPYRSGYDGISTRKVFAKNDKSRFGFRRWNYLLTLPVEKYDTMHYNLKDIVRNIVYQGKDSSEFTAFMADLHNAKNSPRELQTLVDIMKKNKLRNASDVWDFLINRWEPIIKQAEM